MRKVCLFKSSSNDPTFNLALEQYLFEKKKNEIYIYLWQNDHTVVIGRYQNIFEEVDMDYAKEQDIRIVRRDTGGGAVYHDLGNLNYSFIVDSESDSLKYCSCLLGDVLNEFGIKYCFEGRNDILVDGFKVSGTAQHENDGKILHHGTLLVDSNLEVMQRVLTRNNKISDSKSTKSNPHRVGNLAALAPQPVRVNDIITTFEEVTGCHPRTFEENDGRKVDRIEELIRDKYSNDKWTFGFQPEFNFKNTKRFSSGSVSIDAHIENNIIQSINFSGDFFALKDIDELEMILVGCKLSDDLVSILDKHKGGEYIKGVSSAELAGMIQLTF